jgi:hypothetical protein
MIADKVIAACWQTDAPVVYCLANNGSVATGQLAVFQGASEVPIADSYGPSEQCWKNSQQAAARRVALKMGGRLGCSSITYRFGYGPSSRLAGSPF